MYSLSLPSRRTELISPDPSSPEPCTIIAQLVADVMGRGLTEAVVNSISRPVFGLALKTIVKRHKSFV